MSFHSLNNSVLHELTTAQTNEDIEFIVPPWPLEVMKKRVLVEIPYCLKNAIFSNFSYKINIFCTEDGIKWEKLIQNIFLSMF